jgi:cell division transport system ATP-binding protein
MGLFRRFNEVGVTMVVATHDLHLVRESGLREIVLDDGRSQTPPMPPMQALR